MYELRRDIVIIAQVAKGKRPSRPTDSSEPWSKWGLTQEMWRLIEDCWKRIPAERPKVLRIMMRIRSMKQPPDSRPKGQVEFSPQGFRNRIYAEMCDEASLDVLESVLVRGQSVSLYYYPFSIYQ